MHGPLQKVWCRVVSPSMFGARIPVCLKGAAVTYLQSAACNDNVNWNLGVTFA